MILSAVVHAAGLLPSQQWLFGVRLVLSPALIGIACAIARRWGPDAAGRITALPLTSGPVALVFSLEHGVTFAAAACEGFLVAVLPLTAYALAYAWMARCARWQVSAGIAGAAYIVCAWVMRSATPSLGWALALAVVAVLAGHALLPGVPAEGTQAALPRWDIPVRVLLSALTVWLIAANASAVGPRISSLLTAMPITATIMATFTHRLEGVRALQRFLHGLLLGFLSYAAFFALLGVSLPLWGNTYAFALATLGAFGVQLLRLAPSRRPHPGASGSFFPLR